jgi:hypothetical protein
MVAGRLIRICMVLSLVAGACFALAPVAGAEEVTPRDDIWIEADTHFNPANGVRRGSGTARDPFVISGWDVSTLYVKDTSAHVLVRDNVIDRLYLNWNGPRVKIVDNQIGDLRVNENIDRTGAATSGVIAHNKIGIVGQLRHFDGTFAHNTVTGDDLFDGTLFEGPAIAFDGFNGARFVHNTINGYVDITLHGHHHGSGFGKKSHYHGMPDEEHEGHEGHGAEMSHDSPNVDHTKRYHELWVAHNKITAPGSFALLYNDQAHRANDTTAASEYNEALKEKHVHHTRVHLLNNTLIGSGLRVDTFNAKDENHLGTARGMVEIRGNTIKLEAPMTDTPFFDGPRDGITVDQGVDVLVKIVGNAISAPAAADRSPLMTTWVDDAGINLWAMDQSRVYIARNSVTNTVYGIRAADFTKTVHWAIRGLATQGVAQPVYYDNSVPNHPRRGD